MKRMALAWRAVAWLLSIGWVPVIVEDICDSLFHLSQRAGWDWLIIIIPYIEFITIPLTLLAALIAVYRAVRFLRHNAS
jgi:hypothetical protein